MAAAGAPPGRGDAPSTSRPRRGLLPPELVDLFTPPLQVGGAAGGAGLIYGTAVGIVRDISPAFSAVVSGIKWFTLGSSFWLSRSVVIKAWGGDEKISNADRTKASAIAGGTAGMVGTLLRPQKRIVSAAIAFSLVGGAGQAVYNAISGHQASATKSKGSGWLDSKWSPVKRLTDDDYRELMGEKMLKLDADIALIDDKIASLRAMAVGLSPTSPPAAGSQGHQ